MNFMPEIKISLLSGIFPFTIYLILFSVTIFSFPKENRLRLYDRSYWTKKQKIYTVISKLFALINIVLIIFSTITDKIYLIVVGVVLFVVGATIMVSAIITFCSTPLGKPITKGLYKYSRNPQMIGIWTIFLSIGILINSMISIILLILNILFSHQYIKAEEQTCIKQYGDEYVDYLKSKPRYFLFL